MTEVMVGDVVLTSHEVAARRARPLAAGADQVGNVVLSQHDGTLAGVLHIPPGVTLPTHAHRHMGHHVFVASGRAFAFGRTMPAGSYWFVGPGHTHDIQGMAPEGCTLFYVDVPED